LRLNTNSVVNIMVDIKIKHAMGGYDLANMDKEEAHRAMQEQFFAGDPVEFKDCHAKGLIVDSEGYLYLQIRPPGGRDNGGLIDTTWGSHIAAGDTTLTSVMYESARELGIATTVFDDQHFFPMLENHPDITSELAVTRQAAYLRNFQSERLLPDGNTWKEPCELSFFVSYFDGKFRQQAKNGAGMTYRTLDALQEEVESNPERFTFDLKELVRQYAHAMVAYKDLSGFSPSPNVNANELVQQFSLDGRPLAPVPRKQAHAELIEAFHAGQPAPAKHRHVRVMMMRSDGSFYLQQRASNKKENPGLIDKPIAGHVGLGDVYDTAVIHECNDELAIPAAVLPEEDYAAIVANRPEVLRHQAVLTRVATLSDYVSKDRTLRDGQPWNEHCDTAVYIGCYDGPVRFKDGETSGVEVKDIDHLRAELRAHPEKYTHDLLDLVALLEQRGIVK